MFERYWESTAPTDGALQRLRVEALLRDGSISYRVFCAVVYCIDLITDPDVLCAVDHEIATKLLGPRR